jgi:hypothetical protein
MKNPTAHTRRVKYAVSVLVGLPALALALAACPSHPATSATTNQTTQNNKSGVIASEFDALVPYPFANCDTSGNCTKNPPSDPLEMKNLAARLKAYNSSGSTNYVYIFQFGGGTPVGYYVIRGKVSSTASQMTSTDVNVTCNGSTSCTNLAPGDDGSYGPDEGGQFGVFFITSGGALVETDLPFLVSNAPIPTYVNIPQLQK